MIPVLYIKNLTKVYGEKRVVDSLNFCLYPGQIFGFVGPNGAGKSTTIKMITGLTSITNGQCKICGYDIEDSFQKAIAKVGAIVENPELYPYLSGIDNLKIIAKFYGHKGKKRISHVVKLVGLEKRINEKVSTYSLGMKQRLGIAQALLNSPKLLILDEPTNGLDPDGVVEMRNLLMRLSSKEKITIIISSHNLAELEQVADVIGFIDKGKMVDFKTREQIGEMVSKAQKVQILCNYPNLAGLIIKKKFGINVNVLGNSIILPLKDKYISLIVSFLNHNRIKIYDFKKIKKNLEELYFEILNKKRDSTSIF